MSILTNKHRFIQWAYICIHPFHTRIHLRIQVTKTISAILFSIACTLIVYGAVVQSFCCIITSLEITSSSSFITQAPKNWMIAISKYHTVNTINKSRYPRRHITDRLISMVFQISLIHCIKSEIIEHSIHLRIIRIMRSTDSINIILFHQCHITQHWFYSNSPTINRMCVMSISSLEKYSLSINIYHCTLQFYIAETILGRKDHFIIIPISLDNMNRIQVRSFSCPCYKILQLERSFWIYSFFLIWIINLLLCFCYQSSIWIE